MSSPKMAYAVTVYLSNVLIFNISVIYECIIFYFIIRYIFFCVYYYIFPFSTGTYYFFSFQLYFYTIRNISAYKSLSSQLFSHLLCESKWSDKKY